MPYAEGRIDVGPERVVVDMVSRFTGAPVRDINVDKAYHFSQNREDEEIHRDKFECRPSRTDKTPFLLHLHLQNWNLRVASSLADDV